MPNVEFDRDGNVLNEGDMLINKITKRRAILEKIYRGKYYLILEDDKEERVLSEQYFNSKSCHWVKETV